MTGQGGISVWIWVRGKSF